MYRISDIILCIMHDEGLRCLLTMDISTATIASVFRLGFLVFKQDRKSESKVGVLLIISLTIERITVLKSLTESLDFSRVIELKSSEEIPATSLWSTWPITLTSVAFVALFFKHCLAKEL